MRTNVGRDADHLFQFFGAHVGAVREAKVDDDELAMECLVGHGAAEIIDELKGAAELGAAKRLGLDDRAALFDAAALFAKVVDKAAAGGEREQEARPRDRLPAASALKHSKRPCVHRGGW